MRRWCLEASVAARNSGYRNRLFGAVHAEAAKRGMDHRALHDLVRERFGLHSMSDITAEQLHELYRAWTKKTLRRKVALPKPGDRMRDASKLVSAEEMIELEQEFSRRGMTGEERRGFVRRQLGGKEEVHTRGGWAAVLFGLREWRKREERKAAAAGRPMTGEGACPTEE